nr:ABC transporter permease [Halalkalirubrum salinum]
MPAILLAYVFGSIGGVVMAWRRGEPLERVGLLGAIIFRSTPRFWLGIILLFVFAGILGWFPSFGMLSQDIEFRGHLALLLEPDFYHHIILPIASMTFYLMGLPLLLMRTSMLEVINEDFVDVCIAKGLTQREVMFKHVARNALLPVVTAFAVGIAFSFGGNVLVETVFSYPGVGRLMVDSVFRSDYPVAQMSFLMMAAVVLTMNFLADLTYFYLDPRVKAE